LDSLWKIVFIFSRTAKKTCPLHFSASLWKTVFVVSRTRIARKPVLYASSMLFEK
jgi:hypothetical protein